MVREYTYSTPGIWNSIFSSGVETSCSTSCAEWPGNETITLAAATMIWGSSSRGVTSRATTPAAIETRMNTSDRFDSRNFRTMRMVRDS